MGAGRLALAGLGLGLVLAREPLLDRLLDVVGADRRALLEVARDLQVAPRGLGLLVVAAVAAADVGLELDRERLHEAGAALAELLLGVVLPERLRGERERGVGEAELVADERADELGGLGQLDAGLGRGLRGLLLELVEHGNLSDRCALG